MAVRRLTTELDKLATAPIPNVSASMVGEDRFKWTATFLGPEGSPYEGGVFAVSVAFPADYPFKPPKLVFTTKIFHPNVKSECVALHLPRFMNVLLCGLPSPWLLCSFPSLFLYGS